MRKKDQWIIQDIYPRKSRILYIKTKRSPRRSRFHFYLSGLVNLVRKSISIILKTNRKIQRDLLKRLGCKRRGFNFQKAVSVGLTVLLIFQIIAGPFVPLKFSLNPPRISLQEARAAGTPIAICAELQNMENDLTASYYLTNDIDCLDTTTWNWNEEQEEFQGFRPVGYYDEEWNEFPFTRSFDGRGYKITNLYMNWVEIDGVFVGGLFGYAKNARIKNVGLENASITIQHTEWGGQGRW